MCAMFGENRDISFILQINHELLERIIEQKIGYYKIDLDKTNSNIYGESLNKFYKDPVLVDVLIERGDQSLVGEESTFTLNQLITVKFLKDTLINMNLVPESGDVILWNEAYFEVTNVNENQFIVGKDPDYAYDTRISNFGRSLSIVVTANYVRPERWGLGSVTLGDMIINQYPHVFSQQFSQNFS